MRTSSRDVINPYTKPPIILKKLIFSIARPKKEAIPSATSTKSPIVEPLVEKLFDIEPVKYLPTFLPKSSHETFLIIFLNVFVKFSPT